MIKFTKGYKIRIGKIVANYNKKVRDLSDNNKSLQELNAYEFRSQFFTRRELNKQLNKLKRLSRYNDIEDYLKNERSIEYRNILQSLNREMKKEAEKLTHSKFSSVKEALADIETHEVLYKVSSPLINQLKAEKFRLQNWYKGGEVNPSIIKGVYKTYGSSDKGYRQAENYRKQYMKMLDENFSNFKGYKQLKAKLDKIKNPKNFYKTIKGTSADIDLTYYIYFGTRQSDFNNILEGMGLSQYEEEVSSL